MRCLMLYGVYCTKDIWKELEATLTDYKVDYVEYPHSITENAKKVETISEWVFEMYGHHSYDAIIGHSMGGIIALQLAVMYKMKAKRIILLDTNLKPANAFYRNLMTHENMKKYGEYVQLMFNEEKPFYTAECLNSIQADFDYTHLVLAATQSIYALYGDRGKPDYPSKISDLNLSEHVLNRLHLLFIHHACHLIMIENPQALSQAIKNICCEDLMNL